MTSKVTIEAQSHDCEVRQLPVVGGRELPWETLSYETCRFASFIVPAGERLEMYVHSGMSLLVRERVE